MFSGSCRPSLDDELFVEMIIIQGDQSVFIEKTVRILGIVDET